MEINCKLKLSRRMKPLLRSRRIIFFSILLTLTFWLINYFCFNFYSSEEYPDQNESFLELQSRLESLVAQDKGTGCAMPNLDPFSPEVMRYIKTLPEESCGKTEDAVECYFSECRVKKSVLETTTEIKCTYKDILYIDDDRYKYGEPVVVKNDGAYILNASDFVKVSCSGHKIGGLSMRASHWHSVVAGFRPVQPVADPPSSGLNVLMIVFDSTSRNNFIRKMPASYNVLKKLNAVIMESYNIVGLATAGAILPILSGHNDLELPDYRKRPNNTRRMDPKHFIFSHLNNIGYRTAFFEDTASINTFNYRYNGLAYPLADHYGRALFLEKYHNNNRGWYNCPGNCLGSQLIVRFMLKHAEQFMKLDGKKFGFMFNVAQTHSEDNSIAWVDDDLASFLLKFQSNGHLNDTLLFVMSDHGQRVSPLRNTYQGKIEESLPFVSIILPQRLKKERPDAYGNLVANSKVLTTPYDVHTTVLDALGLHHLRNEIKILGSDLERGLSLLDAVPPSRSCAEAGVLPHWCACANWENVSSADPIFREVALEVANYINRKTEPVRKLCAKRELTAILWVNKKSQVPSLKPETMGFESQEVDVFMDKYSQARDVTTNLQYYQAKIIMSPGEAAFEGSVQSDKRRQSYIVSDGDVSRVNRYGDEPHCITHTYPHLCPFCYCT